MEDTDDAILEAQPPGRHLEADVVLLELSKAGATRARTLPAGKIIVLSMLAGAFITAGALLAALLVADVESVGMRRLLEGFGFSVGFFMVILSGALLFTEVNVEVPATMLSRRAYDIRHLVLRLWVLAAFGNLAGAFLIGQLIGVAHQFSATDLATLVEIAETKARFRAEGGLAGWFRAVVSGMLGNWLVGMAAFLSTMGRTIIGRYVPVFLVVVAFVATGFLHSPANMAFYSLVGPTGAGPGWGTGLWWAILPAAVGNILGGTLLVAVPFWYAGTRHATRRSTTTAGTATLADA
ncbi:MAG: formate/nitrite transporter family protein [Actinomycetota bacterium]